MRELHRCAYFVITLDEDRSLVRRIRSTRAFEDASTIERTLESVVHATRSINRSRFAMLVDSRLAPPRNDPAYEETLLRYEPWLNDGYRRIAVLVRTAAGKLQVSRLGASFSAKVVAFEDEAAALAYLLDPRVSS